MLVYLTLGSSLLFMAAAWPPYNVYIADALSRKDKLTVALIVAAAFVGLIIPTAVIAVGGLMAPETVTKLGGAFVLFTGIRMFFRKPANKTGDVEGEQPARRGDREAAVTGHGKVDAPKMHEVEYVVSEQGFASSVRTGVRQKGESRVARPKINKEAVFTSFFISATPGVFAFLAAEGITKHDLLQTATVFTTGPAGVFLGGVLLAYGVRFVNLPVDKIGGVLVSLMGLKMMFL